MRISITLFCLFFFTNAYSQTDSSFYKLLERGKAEFRKEYAQQDYNRAVNCLEQAVYLNPNNAEARYFLGYAYSRVNSKDGKSIVESSLPLTLKASKQLEEVIRLSPQYKGEKILLDPYSKLTAEWGTMAMGYLYHQKSDSAVYAFQEGEKRGGFSRFILNYNKKILDACSPHAILLSCGDNFTIPIWYLQIVEGYRTDVAIIDVSLLNTDWYPTYLIDNKIVDFDLEKEAIEIMDFCEWSDTEETVDSFSWVIKPSLYDQYLLRGDRILLSLLRQNIFKREVYFTLFFDEQYRLGLRDKLHPLVFIDKLNIHNEEEISCNEYSKEQKELLELVKLVNKNSSDEMILVEGFRFNAFYRINEYLSTGDKKCAKKVFKLMNKYIKEDKYPYQDEYLSRYAEYLKEHLL